MINMHHFPKIEIAMLYLLLNSIRKKHIIFSYKLQRLKFVLFLKFSNYLLLNVYCSSLNNLEKYYFFFTMHFLNHLYTHSLMLKNSKVLLLSVEKFKSVCLLYFIMVDSVLAVFQKSSVISFFYQICTASSTIVLHLYKFLNYEESQNLQ